MMIDRIKAEAKKGAFDAAVLKVLGSVVKEAKPILWEGNNYSEEWIKEAAKRGLPNVASTAEALKALMTPKAINLFQKHGVFSKVEITARYHIWLETYEKIINIEAKTLADIVNTMVIPQAYEFQNELASGLLDMEKVCAGKSVKVCDGALPGPAGGVRIAFSRHLLHPEEHQGDGGDPGKGAPYGGPRKEDGKTFQRPQAADGAHTQACGCHRVIHPGFDVVVA